jgi:hypothetical protein
METRKIQHWTKKENDILIKAINKYPHNRSKAFREANTKMPNRSFKSIEARWYQALGNPQHREYVGTLFMTISNNSALYNRTVVRENSSVTPVGILTRVWAAIKNLLNLN